MANGDGLGWGLLIAVAVGIIATIGSKFLLGEAEASDLPGGLGGMQGTMRSGELPDPATSPRVEDIDREAGAGFPTIIIEQTEPSVKPQPAPEESFSLPESSTSARVADIDAEAGAGGISASTRETADELAEERSRLPDPETSVRVSDIDREAGAGADLAALRELARGGS